MTEATRSAAASQTTARSLPVEIARCLFCDGGAVDVVARGRDYEYDTSPDVFALERCRRCGLVFVQPRPAAEAMSTIYPSNYYAYTEHADEKAFVKFFRDRVERVKVRRYAGIVRAPDARILDIGCGDGRLLEIIQRFGPPGWTLTGIELGTGAAATAAARGFEVRSGDFESLDVGDWSGRFDLALLHHVIEHLREPRAAVRKAGSLLRPGGVLSVETPETRGWDYRLFRSRYWGGWHIPRHFYVFDRATLSRLLEEEGFEVVSVASILSPAFPVHSLANWLSDTAWGRSAARFFTPQNALAIAAATAVEIVQHLLGRPSSNLQLLARKR